MIHPLIGKTSVPYQYVHPTLSKVYEKLGSHRLSSFFEKNVFSLLLSLLSHSRQNGLGCTDALLTINHHLQKSLDTDEVVYCSAAFDKVSHSGLFFKLKSIGVGGSVLFICREFLSNLRQRVVVDGATCEWIPIISRVPQGSVVGLLLYILYTS